MLRQESNVDLGAIRLAGSSTQRHVELDVSVDGGTRVGARCDQPGRGHAGAGRSAAGQAAGELFRVPGDR